MVGWLLAGLFKTEALPPYIKGKVCRLYNRYQERPCRAQASVAGPPPPPLQPPVLNAPTMASLSLMFKNTMTLVEDM